ncbi:MAG: MATE family efflux transporter, partial [Alistipes sp.]|nr:MATE family efflux transporter [Alistipes sp.]
SLSRQLLFLLPGLLLLPHLFADYTSWEASWGVWCAIPLSDLLSAIVTLVLLISQLRKFRAQIK